MYLVKGWGGDIMRLRQNFLLIKWCQDLFQFNYDQSEAMDIIDLMTHLNSWPCALGNSIFQATTLLILFRIQRVYFCWLQKPVWNQNFYISKYFGLWNIDKKKKYRLYQTISTFFVEIHLDVVLEVLMMAD
jgi:hypothetical protein